MTQERPCLLLLRQGFTSHTRIQTQARPFEPALVRTFPNPLDRPVSTNLPGRGTPKSAPDLTSSLPDSARTPTKCTLIGEGCPIFGRARNIQNGIASMCAMHKCYTISHQTQNSIQRCAKTHATTVLLLSALQGALRSCLFVSALLNCTGHSLAIDPVSDCFRIRLLQNKLRSG